MNSKLKLYLVLFVLFAALVAVASTLPTPQASVVAGDSLQVAFMDIGQGDSILLTTPHHKHILIDGGPDTTVLTRLGEEMRFYDHDIDLMIASHNHSDHIAGLNEALRRYNVKQMWISGAIHTTNEYIEMLQEIKNHGVPTEVVWKGKTADIDGVHLEVLHPLESKQGSQPEDQHDATIVAMATYGQKKILLTGDINEGHEQAIIGSGAALEADILKVPHHGSKSGLALNFLNAINPQYAIIQSGRDNSFGHPAQSILDKLASKGVTVFRNDTQGTILAITNGQMLSVTPKK
jgi:competence protein ComEC